MQVFVFFALFSLAAADCGNSCTCGNSNCCQNAYSSGSPYSVFGFGLGQQSVVGQQYGYGQQYSYGQQFGYNQQYGYSQGYGQQYGSGSPFSSGISCLKVDPIPTSLQQYYQNQPLYTRIYPDTDSNRQIDNVCTTYFPLPDDDRTYVSYTSTVYCDGSYSVTTTIVQDVGLGTTRLGNAYYAITQRDFASLGGMIVGCTREEYGENIDDDVYAYTMGSVSPIGNSCVQQVQNVIQCAQQNEGALYVLPYRFPTRCVTQQVCSLTNPLLFPNSPYGASNYGANYGLNYGVNFGLNYGANFGSNQACYGGQCTAF